uniref:Uncharacterized protein n=1 Tax=Micrurus corallinus TaxID=54390 RepID=A0A2D4GFM0_MICCO
MWTILTGAYFWGEAYIMSILKKHARAYFLVGSYFLGKYGIREDLEHSHTIGNLWRPAVLQPTWALQLRTLKVITNILNCTKKKIKSNMIHAVVVFTLLYPKIHQLLQSGPIEASECSSRAHI